jgi:hypothetical protein
MRRVLLAGLIVAAMAGSADALTIRDIVELTRAGLGDDVLLALIEVDGSVFATDTATLKQLKAAGVSERVIVAMVRSGRENRFDVPLVAAEPIQPEAPAPQVVVLDHHEPVVERVREVPVAVPVYIPVYRRHPRATVDSGYDATGFVPFQSGPPVDRTPRQAEPVYWGFGGKLRPDAWQPTPHPQPREHDRVKRPDRRN